MVFAVEHDQVHAILILPPQLLHHSFSGRSKSCDPAARLKRHLRTDTHLRHTVHALQVVCACVCALLCLGVMSVPVLAHQPLRIRVAAGKQAFMCLSTGVHPVLHQKGLPDLSRQHVFCLVTCVLTQGKGQPNHWSEGSALHSIMVCTVAEAAVKVPSRYGFALLSALSKQTGTPWGLTSHLL